MFNSEKTNELTGQRAGFVFSNHLAVDGEGNVAPGRGESQVIAGKLIPRLLSRILIVVVSREHVPEGPQTTGTAFAARLRSGTPQRNRVAQRNRRSDVREAAPSIQTGRSERNSWSVRPDPAILSQSHSMPSRQFVSDPDRHFKRANRFGRFTDVRSPTDCAPAG